MQYWQLKPLRRTNHKLILLVIFSIVISSQLISAHHQIQHLNDYNDIACVQCINSPDQVDNFTALSFIVTTFETVPNLTVIVFNQLATPFKLYSARAPPSIV